MWGLTRGGRKQEDERFEALEKRLEGLERGAKVIRLEWEDVYDRLTRTMGRLNARIRKSESLESPESPEEVTPKGVDPTGTPVGEHAVLVAMRARRGR